MKYIKCMHDGEALPTSLIYLQLSSSKLYTNIPHLVLLLSSKKSRALRERALSDGPIST
jgi:hypothetical protein